MNLQIEYIPITEIKPYEGNAKLHPESQIQQIVKSIEQFGALDPIGIWHGEIVEGHGRYEAAKRLNMDKVPVIRLDDLTDEQRKAYGLIHNQLTMNSGFDLEALEMELDSIADIDMSEFGFEEAFSMDDFDEFEPNCEVKDDSKFFSTAFTFPTEHKKEIQRYLQKNKNDITNEIIKRACENAD